MRKICMSGSMSGVWKRSHGRTSEAPPDERGGYRYVRPTATAPHLDSTQLRPPGARPGGGRSCPGARSRSVSRYLGFLTGRLVQLLLFETLFDPRLLQMPWYRDDH